MLRRMFRDWRDDSPPKRSGRGKPRRSPSLSDDDDDWGPPRRDFSPEHPRGPAQRRYPYPRDDFDDPPPRYSSPGSHSPTPPRHRRTEPADPPRRHHRSRTMDDRPQYDDRRPRGRDEARKNTWNPGRGRDQDVDDFLPRRYRSTTSPPPGRRDRDRRAGTHPEPRHEKAFSPLRDYDSRPRPRHRDTRDDRGRGRDDMDDPHRRRRGRARSLDTEDRYRSKGSQRAKSSGARAGQPGRGVSTRDKFVRAAGDLPWTAFATSAFQAGASAAYKARADPGPWMGKKGTKVATAALGAGIVDVLGSGAKGGKKRR